MKVENGIHNCFLSCFSLAGYLNLSYDALIDLLDELQEHVESIDMANGESSSHTFDLLIFFRYLSFDWVA